MAAKTFDVRLPDKPERPRPLRYTSADGVALFKRFGRPLHALFMEDVAGYRDGKATAQFNPEAQVAVLAAGLKMPEERVSELLDKHLAMGGEAGDLLVPCIKAAFYSGILTGKSVDLDAKKEDSADEDEPGKEKEPTA